MNELFVSTEKGLSSERIRQLECERNVLFPDDFKAYLMEINGGEIKEPVEFSFKDLHDFTTRPYIMLGFNGEESRDIPTREESLWDKPAYLIPIADDGAEYLIMDVRPERFGHIYIRANNAPYRTDPIVPRSLFDDPDQAELYHPIADSFSEFMDLVAGRRRN